MEKYKVPKVLKLMSQTNDERELRIYENLLSFMFAVPTLLIGGVSNLVFMQYVSDEVFSRSLLNSIFMFLFAIAFVLGLKFIKDEELKSNIFTFLFVCVFAFIVIRFYYFMGPSVWSVSLILIMISMLHIKKTMLIFMAIDVAVLGVYVIILDFNYYINTAFYIVQTVSFALVFIIAGVVHEIIRNRYKTIMEQYKLLYTSEEKLKLTFASVGDGVIITNNQGIVEFINPIGVELTGGSETDVIGKQFSNVLHILDEHTKEVFDYSNIQRDQEEGTLATMENAILVRKDGTELIIEQILSTIKNYQGNTIGNVLVFRDVTKRNLEEKKIEYLSYHDQLTGIYNRRFFEEECSRLDNSRNLPISIIFADVNGLKIFNDAFGHEYGDELILRVANVLQSACRKDDILARTGGDEFIILLPKTNKDSANKILLRINELLEDNYVMNINISVSFGIDTKEFENQSLWNMIKSAEDFMYQNKLNSKTYKRKEVIETIVNKLNERYPKRKEHSERVSFLCESLGKEYQLAQKDLLELKIAGKFHDIGNIAIDEKILNKSGCLNDIEKQHVQVHADTGYRLLSTSGEYFHIAEYILEHHENWDGTGYPRGLSGDEISLQGRMLAIAEAFDEMIYLEQCAELISIEQAVIEIKKQAGTKFDPNMVRVFTENVIGILA